MTEFVVIFRKLFENTLHIADKIETYSLDRKPSCRIFLFLMIFRRRRVPPPPYVRRRKVLMNHHAEQKKG